MTTKEIGIEQLLLWAVEANNINLLKYYLEHHTLSNLNECLEIAIKNKWHVGITILMDKINRCPNKKETETEAVEQYQLMVHPNVSLKCNGSFASNNTGLLIQLATQIDKAHDELETGLYSLEEISFANNGEITPLVYVMFDEEAYVKASALFAKLIELGANYNHIYEGKSLLELSTHEDYDICFFNQLIKIADIKIGKLLFTIAGNLASTQDPKLKARYRHIGECILAHPNYMVDVYDLIDNHNGHGEALKTLLWNRNKVLNK